MKLDILQVLRDDTFYAHNAIADYRRFDPNATSLRIDCASVAELIDVINSSDEHLQACMTLADEIKRNPNIELDTQKQVTEFATIAARAIVVMSEFIDQVSEAADHITGE